MATEAIPEGNMQHDDQLINCSSLRQADLDHPEEDYGCGRDYYDSEGVPVHVLDSGEEIKLPSVPKYYYGVKNGVHCRVPICEEMEETIEDLPPGVHRGPPGYLKDVWNFARKAAYQARTKASEAALANMYERELKLQVYFLKRSIEAWKLKTIHLKQCTHCFVKTPTAPTLEPNPPPPSTTPPAAATATVSEAQDPILNIIMQAKPSTATTSSDSLGGVAPTMSCSTLPSSPSMVAAAAPPLMNGAMPNLSYNPITSDAIVTATVNSSSLAQLSPPVKENAKATEKMAVKTPTPTRTYARKGGRKRKELSVDIGLGLSWNIPKKKRTLSS
ncbi:hypothetical protein LINPERHAP1_LOCUS26041 [Linum perenne]